MSRSLSISPASIDKVKQALKRNGFPSQQAFATDLGLARSTVSNFFNGKPVEYLNFVEICEKLGIDWQAIAQIETPTPISDPNFVGRAGAIADLQQLERQGLKMVVIQAAGGVGKTTLARQYLRSQAFEVVLELLMAKEKANITAVESVVEEWLKKDLQEEPGREFGVALGRLKRQLQERKVGILIDNLEPALDAQGKIIEPHRRYIELLRVLGDSSVKSLTLITSRDRLMDDDVSGYHYFLPGLEKVAWEEFFSTRQINLDAPTLTAMHKAYGGNAKAMGILCGAIIKDFDGDMVSYWQENGNDPLVKTDLKNLVVSQFNRLQSLDINAYNLLCRLGCYRYQDVPTVPTEGLLCLLWDVPENQRRRVIEFLRDRSLIESCKKEYWLHPAIKAEAVERLRDSTDWEKSNLTAADFWTESVTAVKTVEDAINAFEAYYHYIEIKNFNQAAGVILYFRKDVLIGDNERLGFAFWRLGLLNQLITGINKIIAYTTEIISLINFNLMLGYAYNLIGCIKKSIEHNNICLNLIADATINENESRYETLKAASLQNIACAQIDLWDLEEAVKTLSFCISITENTNCHRYSVDCYYILSFVYYQLNKIDNTVLFLQKAYEQIEITKWSAWSKGYALLFLGATYNNLGKIDSSFDMYQQALTYAEESHYTQVKAKALTGLAELYRIQTDFDTALAHHAESIELLDKIGAKCDLAEAYYQLGLTYQKMGETEKSQENFQTAIRLYDEMEAPRQVEKVQKAIASKPELSS